MKHDQFVQHLTDERVLAAIADVEARSGAKIGLVISRRRGTDALTQARGHFRTLKLDRSPPRHGVLIFIAPRSQSFAIYADDGARASAEQPFWDHLRDELAEGFQHSRFTEALVEVIREIGDVLARRFGGASRVAAHESDAGAGLSITKRSGA